MGLLDSDLEVLDVVSVCKIYYLTNNEPICIYCSTTDNLITTERCYRQCEGCKDKLQLNKRV